MKKLMKHNQFVKNKKYKVVGVVDRKELNCIGTLKLLALPWNPSSKDHLGFHFPSIDDGHNLDGAVKSGGWWISIEEDLESGNCVITELHEEVFNDPEYKELFI